MSSGRGRKNCDRKGQEEVKGEDKGGRKDWCCNRPMTVFE